MMLLALIQHFLYIDSWMNSSEVAVMYFPHPCHKRDVEGIFPKKYLIKALRIPTEFLSVL